jgi:hypothetical protein
VTVSLGEASVGKVTGETIKIGRTQKALVVKRAIRNQNQERVIQISLSRGGALIDLEIETQIGIKTVAQDPMARKKANNRVREKIDPRTEIALNLKLVNEVVGIEGVQNTTDLNIREGKDRAHDQDANRS